MNVTITMEIPVEMLTDLQALLTGNPTSIQELYREPVPVPEVPAVAVTPVAEEPAEKPEPIQQGHDPAGNGAEPVTKSMIRAKGLELTQAGKKDTLEAVFKKFGADKLRDIKEEDYAEVYTLLGEL